MAARRRYEIRASLLPSLVAVHTDKDMRRSPAVNYRYTTANPLMNMKKIRLPEILGESACFFCSPGYCGWFGRSLIPSVSALSTADRLSVHPKLAVLFMVSRRAR